MTNYSGQVVAALQVGSNTVLIRPKRGLYNIKADDGTAIQDIIAHATIEEHHHDEIEITEHPVEQGAMITDHAFKRPAEVTLTLGWSNSPASAGGLLNPLLAFAASQSSAVNSIANLGGLAQGVAGLQSAISGSNIEQIKRIYQSLLQLQEKRALFTLYTGKRVYVNMLCKSLATETNFKSANSLPITMVCKQIILVNSRTVQLPKATQKQPALTASQVDTGNQSLKPITNLSDLPKLKNLIPRIKQ